MTNAVLAFLSRDWAGLALAGATALPGIVVLALARADAVGGSWGLLGIALLAVAGAMATGATIHLVRGQRVRRRYPVPGLLVDVGGYRMHVLAEGDRQGRPPVVWLPGGHAAGFALHHLHRALREETRSILVDRPGTGWSDQGPFPRTTAREAGEVMAALDGAGEQGPFVLVGHSFGGLLAANIARRWPERVAAVVLVDATPPDTIIYGPRLPSLSEMQWGAVRNALPRLFGFDAGRAERTARRNQPEVYQRIIRLVDERLGEAGVAMRAIEGGTRSACAGASIFSELTRRGLAEAAWETVVYEGDLGDLPVYLVAPAAMSDEEFEAVAAMIEHQSGGPIDRDRLRRFYARSRERYLSVSSRAQRVNAPAGTGHNFPYEAPEFLLEVVRSTLTAGAETP